MYIDFPQNITLCGIVFMLNSLRARLIGICVAITTLSLLALAVDFHPEVTH